MRKSISLLKDLQIIDGKVEVKSTLFVLNGNRLSNCKLENIKDDAKHSALLFELTENPLTLLLPEEVKILSEAMKYNAISYSHAYLDAMDKKIKEQRVLTPKTEYKIRHCNIDIDKFIKNLKIMDIYNPKDDEIMLYLINEFQKVCKNRFRDEWFEEKQGLLGLDVWLKLPDNTLIRIDKTDDIKGEKVKIGNVKANVIKLRKRTCKDPDQSEVDPNMYLITNSNEYDALFIYFDEAYDHLAFVNYAKESKLDRIKLIGMKGESTMYMVSA